MNRLKMAISTELSLINLLLLVALQMLRLVRKEFRMTFKYLCSFNNLHQMIIFQYSNLYKLSSL